MRIGIFLGAYTPEMGGAFTFQESLLDALRGINTHHEITCFYYGDEVSISEGSLRWVRLVKNPANRVDKPLYEAVLKNHIELVLNITLDYEVVAVPFIYILWDLQHRIQPYFPEVTVSGWTWDSREKYYQHILPRASYVITGTQAGKNEVMDFYLVPAERVKVLPFPTPEYALQAAASPTQGAPLIKAPYLFYPAQFWPHKNHVALLLSLKILLEQEQLDFSIVFTGSDQGNLKYIQQTVAELGLTGHVHFRGFVPRSELIQLYQNAFAMVFPSFFGPDNIPPLEAFALGCPVIAAQVPGAEEQMGDAALLFNPADDIQLAATIKKLYADPSLRETLIQRGKLRAHAMTADGYIRGFFKIVEEFQAIRRCWSSREPYKHP